MTSKIVVDGKLTVPLFHGTSTLFCKSIRDTGLGGRKLLDEIGLRTAIRELLQYEDQLQNVPNWDFEKTLLLKIAEVDQNPIGSFLRYGGTYVTPSKQTGVRYATLYDSGSEALACTLKILRPVVAQLPALASKRPFSTVLAFADQPKWPVLIEAYDVQEAWLLSERGEPCGPVLEFLEDALNDPDIYDLWVQQANFELRFPIPPSQLRFYKIVSTQSGHDSPEDVRLDPL